MTGRKLGEDGARVGELVGRCLTGATVASVAVFGDKVLAAACGGHRESAGVMGFVFLL
jgi:hypothetical protein